jgi:hypothetical protein
MSIESDIQKHMEQMRSGRSSVQGELVEVDDDRPDREGQKRKKRRNKKWQKTVKIGGKAVDRKRLDQAIHVSVNYPDSLPYLPPDMEFLRKPLFKATHEKRNERTVETAALRKRIKDEGRGPPRGLYGATELPEEDTEEERERLRLVMSADELDEDDEEGREELRRKIRKLGGGMDPRLEARARAIRRRRANGN